MRSQLEENGELNGELNSRMFCIDNLSGDELSIPFNTGIVMTRFSIYDFSAVSRETVSSPSDVLSLLTVDNFSVNDSSTRRLLFFGENREF